MSCAAVIRHPLASVWQSPLLQRVVGENRPGVMQIYKFSCKKKHGYPLAIHVQSKKLVELQAVLLVLLNYSF